MKWINVNEDLPKGTPDDKSFVLVCDEGYVDTTIKQWFGVAYFDGTNFLESYSGNYEIVADVTHWTIPNFSTEG